MMVLISIVSLSSISNKLDNNFNCDHNLLMPKSSLKIQNIKKYYLAVNWLLITIFDVVRK